MLHGSESDPQGLIQTLQGLNQTRQGLNQHPTEQPHDALYYTVETLLYVVRSLLDFNDIANMCDKLWKNIQDVMGCDGCVSLMYNLQGLGPSRRV